MSVPLNDQVGFSVINDSVVLRDLIPNLDRPSLFFLLGMMTGTVTRILNELMERDPSEDLEHFVNVIQEILDYTIENVEDDDE